MNYNTEQIKALAEAAKLLGDDLKLTPEQTDALKEYEEVQALPWDDAVNYCRQMMLESLTIGPMGLFYYKGCERLLARYDNGERTRELFNVMTELH